MKSLKIEISALLVTMLLLSMAVVPAMSSSTSQAVENGNDIYYTEAELQTLYVKYDIMENDVKFARSELPNYLDGTLLCSDVRVIVTEDGKPLENMKKGVDYDMIISEQEMVAIMDDARIRFIAKYGVDPSNPKLDVVNGYTLPKEEASKLVENGKLSIEDEKTSV